MVGIMCSRSEWTQRALPEFLFCISLASLHQSKFADASKGEVSRILGVSVKQICKYIAKFAHVIKLKYSRWLSIADRLSESMTDGTAYRDISQCEVGADEGVGSSLSKKQYL